MSTARLYTTSLKELLYSSLERKGFAGKDCELAWLILFDLLKQKEISSLDSNAILKLILSAPLPPATSKANIAQLSEWQLAARNLEQFAKTNSFSQREVLLQSYLLALARRGCSQATIKNYNSDIRQIYASSPQARFEELFTETRLIEFAKSQERIGLAPATIKRKLTTIAQFAKWQAQHGALEENQAEKLGHFALNFGAPIVDPPTPSSFQPITIPDELIQRHDHQSDLFIANEDRNNSAKISSSYRTVEQHAGTSKINERKKPISAEEKEVDKETQTPSENTVVKIKPFGTMLQMGLSTLALLVSVLGFGLFAQAQFFSDPTPSFAFPSTLTRPARTLSFQGRLTDVGTNPVTGSTAMTFRLFDTGPGLGGTELWSGTCNVDPDQDGIFATGLGDECGDEISDDVFSENSSVWLQVEVGSEVLTPRQSIKSVPYALNTETLQGYPASSSATANTVPVVNSSGEVVFAVPSGTSLRSTTGMSVSGTTLTLSTVGNGNITLDPGGLGETLVKSNLQVDGSATVGGSLAVGYATNANGGGSAIFSGNVGIGTTSPGANLQIVDDADSVVGIAIGNDNNGSNAFTEITLQNDLANLAAFGIGSSNAWSVYANRAYMSTNTAGYGLSLAASNTMGDIRLFTGGDDPNNERMRIDSDGNVGIGTTAPTQALDVDGQIRMRGGSPATGYILTSSDNNGTATWTDPSGLGVRWNSILDPNANKTFSMGTYTTGFNWATGTSTSDLFSLTSDASANGTGSLLNIQTGTSSTLSPLRVRAGSAEALFVNSSGNVGVGTTGPDTKLDLVYNEINQVGISITNQATGATTGSALALINDAGVSSGIYTLSSTYSNANYPVLTANGMSLYSPNNMGLVSNTGYIAFQTGSGASNERMRITSSGNVGIGTTSPSTFKLETAGSIGPSADNVYNLGSSGRRWANIYASNFVGTVTPSGFTEGPVIFGGASGALAQDNALWWDNSNKRLGIGTTTPGSKLQITDATYSTFIGGSGLAAGSNIYATTTMNIGTSTNNSLVQYVNGSARLTLSSVGNSYFNSGNVGIGTTSTLNKLQVTTNAAGDGILVNNTLASSYGTINFRNSSGTTQSRIHSFNPSYTAAGAWQPNGLALANNSQGVTLVADGASGIIRFFTAGTAVANERMRVASNGNVGVGITGSNNVLAKMHIQTGSSGQTISANQSGLIIENNGNSNSYFALQTITAAGLGLNVTNAGNVGINVAAPSQKLDVGGNVNISSGSNYMINGVPITAASYWTLNGSDLYPNDTSYKVGIGTTSPSGILEAYADAGRFARFSSGAVRQLSLKNNDNSSYSGLILENTQTAANYGTGMTFNLGYGGSSSVAGTAVAGGKLAVNAEQAWTSTTTTQDSYMAFSTVLDGTLTERMRISSNGSVTAGTYNSQTISSAASFTGTVAIATGIELATGGSRYLSYYGVPGNGYYTRMEPTANSGFGTYGPVSGDWALYNKFSGTATRGWIWQGGATNVAGLDLSGNFQTAGYINSISGFRVNGSATSGQYLRGNGTNFVSSAIQAADVPTLNQDTTGSSYYVRSIDTRAVNDEPDDFGALVKFDFKSNSTNGLSDGGTYNGVMTWRKYGNATDFSGGPALQLAYTDNANLWLRTSSSATAWNSWNKIWHGGNDGSGSGLDADLLDGISSASFVQTSRTLTLNGTTNQITVNPTGAQDLSANRSWTLSLPQDIHTSATPQFARLGLGAAANGTYHLNLNGALLHGTSTGLGIGTTSPRGVLDVKGRTLVFGDTTNAITGLTGSAGDSRFIIDKSAATNVGSVIFRTGGASKGEFGVFDTNNDIQIKTATGTAGSETYTPRITILNSNGNVGIGTTSPSDALQVIGDVSGQAVNGLYSNLYRFGGLYFTWDSDSYGTNTHHSIRSTYGDTYGDNLTMNSFGNIRLNIDSNNNSTSVFEIGNATTDVANVLLQLNESGNIDIAGTLTSGTGNAFQVAANGNLTAGTLNSQTISSAASFTGTIAFATLGTANTGTVLCRNSSNQLAGCSSIAATSLPFSGLTSATNTSAAMVVGNGASLNYTGTGTINASSLEGLASSQFGRSFGTQAFTSSTTTADFITELTSKGLLGYGLSSAKGSWSYAGNSDIADTGFGAFELAGTSLLTWNDGATRTILAVRPTTGAGGGQILVYNDQGSGYSPGWRQIWTNTTDGSGSGLDADLLDGISSASFVQTSRTLTLNGTTNQITVNPTGAQDLSTNRSWTLSLPQNIHTSATPTFGGMTLNGDLNFGPEANRQVIVGRRTTTAAGSLLTLQAGGARSGQTDLAGGELRLSSGIATGTGSSFMSFYTTTAGTTGTTDRTPTEKMRILANGNVGIGTTSPGEKLDINGNLRFTIATSRTITIQAPSGNGNGGNLYLTAGNHGAGVMPVAGGNVYIDGGTNGGGGGSNVLLATQRGNVGIKTTTPGYDLTVNGNINATSLRMGGHVLTPHSSADGFVIFNKWDAANTHFYFRKVPNRDSVSGYTDLMVINNSGGISMPQGGGTYNNSTGAWVNGSDRSFKTNIADLTKYGLSTINKIRPTQYTVISSGVPQIGFIAQELQPIIPELVSSSEDGKLGVNYGGLTVVLTRALQELDAKVDSKGEIVIEGVAEHPVVRNQTTDSLITITSASAKAVIGNLIAGIGTLANLTVAGTSTLADVTATGLTTLANATVTGATNLTNVTVTGASNLADVTVSGVSKLADLTVTGTSTLADVTTSSLSITADSLSIAGVTLREYIAGVVQDLQTQGLLGQGSVTSLPEGSVINQLEVSELTAGTATISGLQVGDVSAGSLSANSITTGDITATGSATLEGLVARSVNITDNLNVDGNTTLLGQLTIGDDTSISGTLSTETVQTQTLEASRSLLGEILAGTASVSGSITADNVVLGSTTEAGDPNQLVLDVNGSARMSALEAKVAEFEQVNAMTASLYSATISGSLTVGSIVDFDRLLTESVAPSLLQQLIGYDPQATKSGEIIAGITGIDINSIPVLDPSSLDELSVNPTLLGAHAGFFETYLQVNGNTALGGDIKVGGDLVMSGGISMRGNRVSISSVSSICTDPLLREQLSEEDELVCREEETLYISTPPSGALNLMNGLVLLADGKVIIDGEVTFKQPVTFNSTLLTDLVTPTTFDRPIQFQVAGASTETGEVTQSRFEIVNELGTPVATISAEGKAEFAGEVNADSLALGSQDLSGQNPGENTQLTSSKKSGKAKITAGTSQLTIANPNVSAESLIYVTPQGSTGNQTIYVKEQLADDPNTPELNEARFTIGFDQPVNNDVIFNWWVVN